MSSESSTALATDAEIEVALAEAEAQAAEIPSLEAGAAPKVVHIPVEGPPLPRSSTPQPAETAPVTDTPEPPVTLAAQPRKRRLRRALYALIDRVLWAFNRPFQWLSPQARHLIGLMAIATLVTSLLALLLLPASR